jgi:single-strand DNA-binding protein
MLNQCSFIGNLGADPETRSFQNGGKVCNLRLAVTEKWKTSAGEKKEKTEWVSVAVFGDGLAGVAERYLRKGSKVFVQGKLSTRKWQDASGADRYSTEVVLQGPGAVLTMLDGPGKSDGEPRQERSNRAQEPHPGAHGGESRFATDDLDDSFPF